MDHKTAALCALALVSGLDLASAFRGSGAPSMRRSMSGPVGAAASSQLPSHIGGGSETRALNPAMINQHRSVVSMTSESVPAACTRSPGLVPSLPLVVSTPQLVATTDSAGFSSIPVGVPRAGHSKAAFRASRLTRQEARNKSVNPLGTDTIGFPWLPLGGAAKQAGVYTQWDCF